MILSKTMIKFLLISKTNESISIKAIDKTSLSEQTKFRLSEIIEFKIIFIKRLIKENHTVNN